MTEKLKKPATPSRLAPPHSYDAERAVLGSVLISPGKLDDVAAVLRGPDDFLKPSHREIYEAMVQVAKRQPVDVIAVADELGTRGMISRLEGGEMYLLALSGAVPTAESAVHYAKIVRDKAVLRRVISQCYETIAKATGDVVADELVVEHVAGVEGTAGDASGVGPERIGKFLERGLGNVEARSLRPQEHVIKTGLRDFDEKFGGIYPGYTLVAARPGIGKTAWAIGTLIRAAMTAGVPGLLVSHEMSKQQVLERAVSFTSRVEGRKIVRGSVDYEDWKLIRNGACKTLADIPFDVDDRNELSFERVCAEIKRWVNARRAEDQRDGRRRPLVVAIDSMSLLGLDKPSKSRTDDVTSMSRKLKKLSDKLKIALILIVHLNREIDKGKKPRKPVMSDLREAGGLEQDADSILFPYREPGQKGASTGPVDATIIVGKSRNDVTGEALVSWDGRFMAYYDRAEEDAF